MRRDAQIATFSGGYAMAIIAALVLASALLLLNDVPEIRRSAPEGTWPPSWIARTLMLPIAMPGMTDIRRYVLPVGLAMVLITFAFRPPRSTTAEAAGGAGETSGATLLSRWWFEGLAAVVIVVAVCSALANGTYGFSRGWIFGLILYSAWSIVLRRFLPRERIPLLLLLASGVAALAVVTALWHRLALGVFAFELPVGPVTITGALGALMTAMGAAWLFSGFISSANQNRPRGLARTVWVGLVVIAGLVLTIYAARRASWLAIGVALAVIVVAGVFKGGRSGKLRWWVIVGLVIVPAAGFVVQQRYLSPRAGVRQGIQSRTGYWKHVVTDLPRHPFLGVGPDMFVCDMTSVNALDHSTQAKQFGGRVEYDAHSEWLQAIHELGIVGGLSYCALPIATIVLALRRYRRGAAGGQGDLLLCCAAGLIAIMVYELLSINLRHPVVSPWYWTLLGVTAALLRIPQAAAKTSHTATKPSLLSGSLVRLGSLVGAALILLITVADARCAVAHERARLAQAASPAEALADYDVAIRQFGSRAWLSTRYDRAMLCSQLLKAAQGDAAAKASGGAFAEIARRTVDAWRELVDRCPAYPDAGYKLSEALVLSGERAEALATLERYLKHVDPHDLQANILRIYLGGQDAMQNLLCVRAALVRSPMNNVLASYIARDLASPEVSKPWADLVHEAWRSIEIADESQWPDPFAPETFRMEVLRLAGEGELKQAADVSRLAAEMYGRQVDQLTPRRRVNAVVADAWYVAARFRFESEPGAYMAVCAAMQKAETYANLQVRFDAGATSQGLDLDPVGLRNRTSELRTLLKFSAMMGMACGVDDLEVARRVNWSLPGDRHAMAQVNAEKARMAAELVAIFDRLPVEMQPPVMPRLKEQARTAAPSP